MFERKAMIGGGFRRSRCRSMRLRLTLGVAGHEIAVRSDTALEAVHVAGALAVAPRPGERRCRSRPQGRGREGPHLGMPRSASGRMALEPPSHAGIADAVAAPNPYQEYGCEREHPDFGEPCVVRMPTGSRIRPRDEAAVSLYAARPDPVSVGCSGAGPMGVAASGRGAAPVRPASVGGPCRGDPGPCLRGRSGRRCGAVALVLS